MTERDDEAPTQRMYRTDIGVIDWARASAAAQALVTGVIDPGNFRVLGSLFSATVAKAPLWRYDGLRAAQLLNRLRTQQTPDDCNDLWQLLFKLFDRKDR